MTTMDRVRSNPYVGPRGFQPGETLYGRDQEVNDLLDLLIAERLVMLYSPSGAGKSSLIQAVLMPALEQEGFAVLPVIRVGHEPPPGIELPPTANRYIFSVLLSLEADVPDAQQIPLDELAALDLPSYLEQRHAALTKSDSMVLLFDQFEEVLNIEPTNQQAKRQFFAQVGAALRDRQRWALFALREDYIAGLDPFLRAIPTRLNTTFRLELLREDTAREAMQKPAQDAGIEFSDAAATKLVNDLRQVQVQQADGTSTTQLGLYVEPVQLQVVCYRLWENLPADTRRIEEADVETVGDVDDALAGYYADRVRAIAATTGVSERAIRDWCDSQLITDQGLRGQVLHSPEQSQGLENTAIRALVDAHLVRAKERRGATWFELAHDRLIQPVRENNAAWREANLSTLQRQADLWDKQSRPDGLLRDAALEEAERWAEAHPDALTGIERDFLDRCREARAIVEREHRQARRIRMLAIGATIISVIAIVAAIFAFYKNVEAEHRRQEAVQAKIDADEQRKIAVNQAEIAENEKQKALASKEEADHQRQLAREEADHQRQLAEEKRIEAEEATNRALAAQEAEKEQREIAVAAKARADRQAELAIARQLAAQANANLEKDLELSILLALEAWKRAFMENEISGIEGIDAARSEAEAALRQAIQAPILRREFKARDAKAVNSIAFTPDGTRIATVTADGAFLWGVMETTMDRKLLQSAENIQRISFSPDGQQIVTASADGTVNLWDANSGQKVHTLKGHNHPVRGIAFNGNGTHVVTIGQDGTAKLWDADSGAELQTLRAYTGQVIAAAFSKDGERLALGAERGIIKVWYIESAQDVKQLRVHTDPVRSIAFSPDGNFLATGDRDGTVKVWEVDSRQRLMTLLGTGQPAMSLAFNPTGSRLATGYGDGIVRVWDVTPGARRSKIAPMDTLQRDDLIQVAKTRLTRELTGVERMKYLGRISAREQHFGDAAPLVRVESARLEDVLASFYPLYAKTSTEVGKLVLRSSHTRDLPISVSIFIPGYMDAPTEVVDGVRLRAAASDGMSEPLTIPLRLDFNQNIRSLTEDVETTAVITVRYHHKWERQIEHTTPLVLRAMGQVAYRERLDPIVAFIDPNDPVVRNFADAAVKVPLEITKPAIVEMRRASENIFKAMQVFEALNEHGVRYSDDTDTPFQSIYGRNTVAPDQRGTSEVTPFRYIERKGPFKDTRYPRELLSASDRAGDCDDLSMLYAALLESLGIRTQWVNVESRVFVMFDSGLPEEVIRELNLAPGLFVGESGVVWVPVETTISGHPFVEAWRKGAAAYTAADDGAILRRVNVHEAWKTYPPMHPTTPLSQIPRPATEKMKGRIFSNLAAFDELMKK